MPEKMRNQKVTQQLRETVQANIDEETRSHTKAELKLNKTVTK